MFKGIVLLNMNLLIYLYVNYIKRTFIIFWKKFKLFIKLKKY